MHAFFLVEDRSVHVIRLLRKGQEHFSYYGFTEN